MSSCMPAGGLIAGSPLRMGAGQGKNQDRTESWGFQTQPPHPRRGEGLKCQLVNVFNPAYVINSLYKSTSVLRPFCWRIHGSTCRVLGPERVWMHHVPSYKPLLAIYSSLSFVMNLMIATPVFLVFCESL
jgi:hypothetical protein